MRVAAPWLTDPAPQAVLGCLAAAGWQALVVGGAVRDAVMGLPPGDVDIATDALPDQVVALAQAARLRTVPTGIGHGTVTVLVSGVPFEVTTFRRDVATDGRRASVAFTSRVEEDARRRDFTMNALYARADGELVDPLGGLEDARAGRVRFIEDAGQRIREDFLRILRFFRFNAWYGRGGIDAAGLAACAALAPGLDGLSRERVGAEMLKLLAAPDPAPAVAAFAASGGLSRVLPGANALPLAALAALEQDAGLAPDPLRRLAAIGGEDVGSRLRLSRRDAARLTTIRAAAAEGGPAAGVAWRHGSATAVDAAMVRAALTGQPLPPDLQHEAERGARAVFPVTAADLMPALAGEALGRRLEELRSRWLESGLRAGRDELLAGEGPPPR